MVFKRDLGSIDLDGKGSQKNKRPEAKIGLAYERLLVYLGIILPTLAILAETQYHLCARHFFDPFPSPSHTLLFAMIPLANLLAWLSLKRNMSSQLGLALFANGMAIGVAILYSLMFLPLVPQSCQLLFCYGVGLLALAPILALIVLSLTAAKVTNFASEFGTQFHPHQVKHLGHLVILTVVLAIELPSTITRIAMGMASKPESMQQGLDLLRSLGDREVMLRACYERSGKATDVLGSLYEVSHPADVETMREIFYRANGRSFNSFPIPEAARATMNHMGTLPYDGMDQPDDEFDFDPDIAGEMVSGVSRGLSASKSKLNAQIDSDACVSQIDWFLDFSNKSRFDREVRSRIRLPHGAAVNQASLIVDGKEYECKITLKEQAREIYRAAVESKKNPLLVSVCGDDTVLVQCYPVPPGNSLSLHLGIVSPLSLNQKGQAVLSLPQFEERNFQISSPHSLSLSANHELKAPWGEFKAEHPNNNIYKLSGNIDSAKLATGGGIVNVERAAGSGNNFWSRDEYDCAGVPQLVKEKLVDSGLKKPARLIVLIDLSASMADYVKEISEALKKLPPGIEVSFEGVGDPGSHDGGIHYFGKPEQLAGLICKGGQGDAGALHNALLKCGRTTPYTAILWLHGAQPTLPSQYYQASHIPLILNNWRVEAPLLYDMQLSSGPNSILDGVSSNNLLKVPRSGTVCEDLSALFEQWENPDKFKIFEFEKSPALTIYPALPHAACARDRVAAALAAPAPETAPVLPPGGQTMKQLAQLWASSRVNQLHREHNEAAALAVAAHYHLVTPVSSAVLVDTVPELVKMSCPAHDCQDSSMAPGLNLLRAVNESGGEEAVDILSAQVNKLSAAVNSPVQHSFDHDQAPASPSADGVGVPARFCSSGDYQTAPESVDCAKTKLPAFGSSPSSAACSAPPIPAQAACPNPALIAAPSSSAIEATSRKQVQILDEDPVLRDFRKDSGSSNFASLAQAGAGGSGIAGGEVALKKFEQQKELAEKPMLAGACNGTIGASGADATLQTLADKKPVSVSERRQAALLETEAKDNAADSSDPGYRCGMGRSCPVNAKDPRPILNGRTYGAPAEEPSEGIFRDHVYDGSGPGEPSWQELFNQTISDMSATLGSMTMGMWFVLAGIFVAVFSIVHRTVQKLGIK